MELDKIYNKHSEIVSRKVTDEYILVPLSNDIADMDSIYTMNEVGAFIWENVDGKNSVKDIVSKVENEFDVNHQTAEEDTVEFLEKIKTFLK